jgi:hypothetical protein
MHTTRTPFGLHWPTADQDTTARLNWLINTNAAEDARLAGAAHQEEIMMMRRPVSRQRAYALFGMLLGTLPPAAIFFRVFGSELTRQKFYLTRWFLLILAMNLACCFAGRFFGSKMGLMLNGIKRGSWTKELLLALFVGWCWATGTGAAGGLIFYGIGAIFGALFAIPVGLLAFSLFMPLHRSFARGGMIEAGHLWPLACGVTMTLTALILGLPK